MTQVILTATKEDSGPLPESELASFALWCWPGERQFSWAERRKTDVSQRLINSVCDFVAHIGVVEVDAPVASSAGGDEAVP